MVQFLLTDTELMLTRLQCMYTFDCYLLHSNRSNVHLHVLCIVAVGGWGWGRGGVAQSVVLIIKASLLYNCNTNE